jgi:hypothetical protein
MSSGNLVSIIYMPETVYGVTDAPLSGVTADTTRFTSETVSGTPTTTVSTEIRTDRMSAGMVTTGLDVGGPIDYELASGVFWDDWFSAAMMEPWNPAGTLAAETVTLTPDPLDDQQADLIITTGDFSTINAEPNDILQLIPTSGPSITVSVISVTSVTELVVATKRGEAPIVAATMDVQAPEYLGIGATQQSFTVGKSYLDVTHDATTDVHSQTYSGTLVNGFSINAAYGEIVTGTFETLGSGYKQEFPSLEQDIVAAGGTVNPADVSSPLNASIDFPLVVLDPEGDPGGTASDFCIESLEITFTNGLDPTQCIGKIEPIGYTLGTAGIDISMSAYNSDPSYDALMAAKLSLTPLGITITAQNADGGYAFRITQAQLSFPDPSSDGQDTQTMIEAAGTGKVGANGESAIVIYKLVGDQ